MASSVYESRKQIIIDSIDNSFSAPTLKAIAINFGYDINAGFTAQEFQDFSRELTAHVLQLIKANKEWQSCYDAEMIRVATPIIDYKLKNACKIATPSLIHYPSPSCNFWRRLISIIFSYRS